MGDQSLLALHDPLTFNLRVTSLSELVKTKLVSGEKAIKILKLDSRGHQLWRKIYSSLFVLVVSATKEICLL